MGDRRAIVFLFAALLAMGTAFAPPSRAQEATPTEVKAAFLLNFLRYTQWPDPAVGRSAPLRVVVLGSRRFASSLRALLGQHTAAGVRVEVLRFGPKEPHQRVREAMASAHAVFVEQGWSDADALMAPLAGQPVLTVGDAPGFAREGGMLGLVQQGSRIVFDANPRAIQDSGLQVSAKVLKLARIVEAEAGS